MFFFRYILHKVLPFRHHHLLRHKETPFFCQNFFLLFLSSRQKKIWQASPPFPNKNLVLPPTDSFGPKHLFFSFYPPRLSSPTKWPNFAHFSSPPPSPPPPPPPPPPSAFRNLSLHTALKCNSWDPSYPCPEVIREKSLAGTCIFSFQLSNFFSPSIAQFRGVEKHKKKPRDTWIEA